MSDNKKKLKNNIKDSNLSEEDKESLLKAIEKGNNKLLIARYLIALKLGKKALELFGIDSFDDFFDNLI